MIVSPDYSQYTINELIDAYQWVSRTEYPQRTANIQKEIIARCPHWQSPTEKDLTTLATQSKLQRLGVINEFVGFYNIE